MATTSRLSSVVDGKREVPVVGNQERYLLAERFTEASYPIPFSYRVRGRLDVARLQAAIDDVVARHDVLRASFRAAGAGFVASIAAHGTIALHHETRAADEAGIRQRISEYFSGKIQNLVPESFARVLLITTGPNDHVLTLSLHHGTADGVSMDIFAREIFDAYNGVAPDPVAPSYYDLMAAAPPAGEDERCFWQEYLAGIDEVPTLQADRNDSGAGTGEVVKELDLAALEKAARAQGVTPFTLMSAITAVVLGRACGSDDMLVTFQSSGRNPFPNGGATIGPFSNTVVLRTRLDPDEPVRELAARQKRVIADALRNEIHPYHLVVRETGVQPRFGINWFPTGFRPQTADATFSDREFLFFESNYDLNIRFVRTDGTLQLLIHYDARQFGRDRIDRLASEMEAALTAIERAPDTRVGDLLPAAAPLGQLPAPARDDQRVFDGFLRQAAAHPDRIALIGMAGTMSYGAVDAASAALGARLVGAGFGPGSRVGILAERGPTLVWTMLAVLRIGATMVPLDSAYPVDRLRTLVGLADIDALILPRHADRPEWVDDALPVLAADDPVAAVPSVAAEALAAGDADAPAYMLFTSGSTGTPKCIATSHRPVVNFLRWHRETFALTADDRFTNLCGLAHDMMIRDVFAPLSIGAQLAIPNQDDIFKPSTLLEWCAAQAPTVTHLTPAMGRLLLLARKDGQTLPFRLMFFGGDRLLPELVEEIITLAPGAEIVNFYGTTETPQAAAFHRCTPGAKWLTHPIGRGIDHFDLRIVDAAHRPVPPGAPGEIAVVTPFLSLGYVRGGEIAPYPERGVYFTGDTGFELPSGDVLFAGRADDQISIRGYRIELEEINAALRAQPQVKNAVALPYGPASDRRIAAFIVPEVAGADIKTDVLTALSTRLPQYMLPHMVQLMEALPLLPNGKLDRRVLQGQAEEAQAELARPVEGGQRGPKPSNESERAIVTAWTSILGRSGISIENSFQDLSGDSLSYVQAYLAVEEVVGSVPEGWQFRSIRELAAAGALGPRWGRIVDTPLVVRAVAISMVVAWHFHLMDYNRGVTSSLFLISGLLFGSFQLVESLRRRNASPVFNLLGRLLLPVMLYTIGVFALRTLSHNPTDPAFLLLYENWFDYSNMSAAEAARHEMVIWYIHCTVQMMLFLALVLTVSGRYFADRIDRFRFSAGLFLAGCVTRFLLPALIVPGWMEGKAPELSAVSYLPTTHLSTFMLGAMLATARSRGERHFTVGALLLYVAATHHFLSSASWLFILVGGLALYFVPQVRLPKLIAQGVFLVSGASLFIYLTHIRALYFFDKVGIDRFPLVGAVLAIVIGVVAWRIWERLFAGLRAMRRRGETEEAAAVSV